MIPIVLKLTAIPVGNRKLGSLGSTHPHSYTNKFLYKWRQLLATFKNNTIGNSLVYWLVPQGYVRSQVGVTCPGPRLPLSYGNFLSPPKKNSFFLTNLY